jgi:hypothetical protein
LVHGQWHTLILSWVEVRHGLLIICEAIEEAYKAAELV